MISGLNSCAGEVRQSRSGWGDTSSDGCIRFISRATYNASRATRRNWSRCSNRALNHHGVAVIDVVSPCGVFNNHSGSTKGYDHVRGHNEVVNRLDIVSPQEPITADYEPGTEARVRLHWLDLAPAEARTRPRPARPDRCHDPSAGASSRR
jgi:hypothetical protein